MIHEQKRGTAEPPAPPVKSPAVVNPPVMVETPKPQQPAGMQPAEKPFSVYGLPKPCWFGQFTVTPKAVSSPVEMTHAVSIENSRAEIHRVFMRVHNGDVLAVCHAVALAVAEKRGNEMILKITQLDWAKGGDNDLIQVVNPLLDGWINHSFSYPISGNDLLMPGGGVLHSLR